MAKKTLLSGVIPFLSVMLAFGQEKKSSTPVCLAPWVLHARLTHETAPEYPVSALENHIQGDVFVQVLVDENGKVQTAKAENCANCSSILGAAAVQTVKKWEYQPAIIGGRPVPVSSWVTFRFKSDGPSIEIPSKVESPKPKKLRISSGVAEANLIHKVEPQYPLMAKASHIQGDVVMQCTIDKEGNMANLKAISGPPALAQAALDAVKQWKYKPYTLNCDPVEVETTITVKFHP